MGAVGQLDQDHAKVPHHRQQHLAEAFGLRLLAALELDLIELGHPIDDLGHIVPEAGGDLFLGRGGVLDDIVQDRRDQRVGVQVQFGEDFRGRHRMGDVRLPAQPLLAQVSGGAELGRGAHAFDLLGGQVGADLAQ